VSGEERVFWSSTLAWDEDEGDRRRRNRRQLEGWQEKEVAESEVRPRKRWKVKPDRELSDPWSWKMRRKSGLSSCDRHCSSRCASSSFHMLVNPLPVAPIISFNCSFLSRADLVHQVLWESQEIFTSLKFSSWSGCLLQAISIRKLSGSPGKCKEIRSVLPMSTVLLSVLAMSTVVCHSSLIRAWICRSGPLWHSLVMLTHNAWATISLDQKLFREFSLSLDSLAVNVYSAAI
jgi:hypothetical protein